MPMPFTRFLIGETIAVTALNAGDNAAYTFWLWREWPQITLAGPYGIATDLALTPVFIAFLSILLGTEPIRRRLWEGKVSAPATTGLAMAFSALTRNTILRATIMAGVCAVMLSMPLATLLMAAGDTALPLSQAVWAKVALTVGFSMIIVPLAALAAASDLKPQRNQTRFW